MHSWVAATHTHIYTHTSEKQLGELDSLCNKISRQHRHHAQKSQKQMLADSRQTPNTFLLASLQHAPLLSYYALFPNTSHLHFHLVIESMRSQLTGDSQTDYELWDGLNVGTYAQTFLLSYFTSVCVFFSSKRYGLAYLFCLQWDHFDRLVIQAVNLSCNKKKKKKSDPCAIFRTVGGW